MIKQFIAASGAALISLLPAQARVEQNTGDLIRLVQSYGVKVEINPADCSSGFMGRFVYLPKLKMQICYQGTKPTAEDHDTVRHETWHYLQWCRNPRALALVPLHKDRNAYIHFVHNALDDSALQRINISYPRHLRGIEYEAFAAARTYSSTRLMSMVREYCTPM